MKIMLIALAAASLSVAPALAQEGHAAHHPEGAANSMDMSKMTPEELHKHCSLIMGGKMQGTPKHDHTAEKLGHAPTMKPPTEAEMKAMHEKCAAVMAADKKAAPPAKP
jgi:hypothetical protein